MGHTPGPWLATGFKPNFFYVNSPEKMPIAFVFETDDAALIANAPRLLAAARALLAFVDRIDGGNRFAAALREVIAAAESNQSPAEPAS